MIFSTSMPFSRFISLERFQDDGTPNKYVSASLFIGSQKGETMEAGTTSPLSEGALKSCPAYFGLKSRETATLPLTRSKLPTFI